jgi:hypothetical protein
MAMGVRQFWSQELEIYDVVPQPNGAEPQITPRATPITGGNL